MHHPGPMSHLKKSRRLRVGRTRVAVVIGATLVLFAGVLSGAAIASTPRMIGSAVSAAAMGSPIRGTATFVGMSTPGLAAAATAAGPAGRGRVMPLLRPPRRSGAKASGPAAAVPAASAHQRSQSTAVDPAIAFDGITAIQNRAASRYDLEPPDEGLAAGNGFVTNFVNVTGAIYRTDGSAVTGPFYLNVFFREPVTANTSDPRVFYDAGSRRWFASMLEYVISAKGNFTESHLDLAVSLTADPAGSWRIYQVPTSDLGHAGCPCLADYPILGISQASVYLSTNEFTADSTGFNGAQLYVISKPQLVAGSQAPRMVTFENLSAAGSPAYHVQPANSYGNAPAEFLLSSLDPNGTFDNRLAVWAVSNETSVTTNRGMPSLSVRIIGSEAYGVPPNAQTPPGFCSGSLCRAGKSAPTTGIVQTDFDAMQETQYINGQLIGALNTGVTVSGDTASRSGVAWFVIRPSLTGTAVDARTHIARQGYLSTNGEYLLYPHVNMTPNGAMALVFGMGGPGTYLSAAYSVAPPGQEFGAIIVAAGGTGPDNGFTGTAQYGGAGRWGDYSNGQIIPGTNRVWLATQYIPNNGDGNANWGNSIFQLNLS